MGSGTHLEVVWVDFGRIDFNAPVDGFCVDVEVLVVVGVVPFVVMVVLVEKGKVISAPSMITNVLFPSLFRCCGGSGGFGWRGMKPRGSVSLPDQSTRTTRE